MMIWSRDYRDVGSVIRTMGDPERVYVITDCVRSETGPTDANPGWHVHVRDLSCEERLALHVLET